MFDHYAQQDIHDDVARAHCFIAHKLELAAADASITRREQRRIARLTTHDPAGVAFSLARFDVAAAHSVAMADALSDHWSGHRHYQDFRYWMGTFCWDAGVVGVGGDHLSTDTLAAMQLKVYKALRDHGIHAVICAEVELLIDRDGQTRPRLLYHIHAVCWRHGAAIKPQLLAAAIMKPGRFLNGLGAPRVKFTSNRWPKPPASTNLEPEPPRTRRPPPSAASISGLARYVTKYPACVKVLTADRRRPGRNRLERDQSRNSAALVLALVTARSRISLFDAVKGLGEGAAVRAAWKRNVMAQLTTPW